MEKVTLTCRKPDGKPLKQTFYGGCLACMGRSRAAMEANAHVLEGATPVTLMYLTVCRDDLEVTKNTQPILERLWQSIPALRTCLYTPEQILKERKAMFDVANYSLNEVMVAMFFLRQMLKYKAGGVLYIDRANPVLKPSIGAMEDLIHKWGLSWEEAYVLAIAPTSLSTSGTYNSWETFGFNGGDGATFNHLNVSKKDLAAVVKGEFEGWSYNSRTYAEHLESQVAYTQSILAQTQSSVASKGSAADMYMKMQKALMKMRQGTGQQETDLFGNVVGEKVKAPTVENVLNCWKEIIRNELGEL